MKDIKKNGLQDFLNEDETFTKKVTIEEITPKDHILRDGGLIRSYKEYRERFALEDDLK